ncbi:MAG: hypothetical protein Q8Q39_03320 [bacterium]|nr:hypothetical protein [bacterium]
MNTSHSNLLAWARSRQKSLKDRYDRETTTAEALAAPYTDIVLKAVASDRQLADQLRIEFQNRLVLDLGCGIEPNGFCLAARLGASAYVGIELNFPKSAQYNCQHTAEASAISLPFIILGEDMQKTLTELEQSSIKPDICIFGGIDNDSYTGNGSFLDLPEAIGNMLTSESLLICAIDSETHRKIDKSLSEYFSPHPLLQPIRHYRGWVSWFVRK